MIITHSRKDGKLRCAVIEKVTCGEARIISTCTLYASPVSFSLVALDAALAISPLSSWEELIIANWHMHAWTDYNASPL